jgi:beta-lactamase class A
MKILLLTSIAFLLLVAENCIQNSSSANDAQANTSGSPAAAPTPDPELQKRLAEIAKSANGKVGVCAAAIETGQMVSLNESDHFAMQSVVKVPISMAVLKKVEEGKLKLDEKIGVTKDDMVPANMHSPLRDANPNGFEMTVRELIRQAISESDGTASDVLQRIAGGGKGVQAYIDSIGLKGIHIELTHKEFSGKFDLQYVNWATPAGAVDLLKKLYGGQGISKENRELLLKFMTESNNPPNRMLAGLPKGTAVAHKTGSGGTQNGITSATNDIGIITMPNGDHIALAVFVGDAKVDLPARENVIAQITKAIFDKWSVGKTEPVKSANFTDRHTLN